MLSETQKNYKKHDKKNITISLANKFEKKNVFKSSQIVIHFISFFTKTLSQVGLGFEEEVNWVMIANGPKRKEFASVSPELF